MSIFARQGILRNRNRLIRETVGDYVRMVKAGGTPVKTHPLSGRLIYSNSGWGLLEVPNALVRGAFDALNEPGAELPLRHNGRLRAHISVFRPEELAQLGGREAVSEWGHHFSYGLGPIKEVEPSGWPEMSKVWFIEITSPALQKLRRSYGLTGLPKDGKFEFHATIAVRRKRVLHENGVRKGADGEKTGDARDGWDARVQQLAGDVRTLREPEAHSVQGLRGKRLPGLFKVAYKFPGLFGGPRSSSERPLPGQVEEPSGVRLWSLRRLSSTRLGAQRDVGGPQDTGPQQEKQSSADQRRFDEDACGVVGDHGAELCHHPHPHRPEWLERREGPEYAGRSTQEKYALVDVQGRDPSDHDVGQATQHIEVGHSVSPRQWHVGRGGFVETDPPPSPYRIKKAFLEPQHLALLDDVVMALTAARNRRRRPPRPRLLQPQQPASVQRAAAPPTEEERTPALLLQKQSLCTGFNGVVPAGSLVVKAASRGE